PVPVRVRPRRPVRLRPGGRQPGTDPPHGGDRAAARPVGGPAGALTAAPGPAPGRWVIRPAPGHAAWPPERRLHRWGRAARTGAEGAWRAGTRVRGRGATGVSVAERIAGGRG